MSGPATRIIETPWRHAVAVVAFYATVFAAFFAPVWMGGRLLAPGDGTLYHVPAFFAALEWWTPDSFAGFPVAAEPNSQVHYPIARVLAWCGAYNVLVISAYVMAAAFTYGYVHALTRSVPAAIASGFIYAAGGFFMARVGQMGTIHGAAWIPLMLWGVERLRTKPRAGSLIMASGAIGLCALGGHPQMLLYGMGLAAAYALVTGWSEPGCWRYYGGCVLALALGAGIGAAQLLPSAELAGHSVRAQVSMDDLLAYALSPLELLQLLFPYLFTLRGYVSPPSPSFSGWGLTETSGYVGWLTLGTAAVALRHAPQRRLVYFWCAVALLTLLVALGDATFLARIIFALPGYNWFRCPGRHLVETTLALAVLAGLGIATLERRDDAQLWRRASSVVLAVMICAVIAVALFGERLRFAAVQRGTSDLSFMPWFNPSVGVPIACALLSAGVLWLQGGARRRVPRRIALIAVLLLDLASFGWFCEWRGVSSPADVIATPPLLVPYRDRIAVDHTRVLTADFPAPAEAAVPNLNWLFGVPNAAGYTSVPLQRYREALPHDPSHSVRSQNRILDILAVRFVFFLRDIKDGFDWGNASSLYQQRDADGHEWELDDVWVTHVAIAGALGNSVLVPDDATVGTLRITLHDGAMMTLPIKAGTHLSEWAYERHDVIAAVRHRRAPIFWSAPVTSMGPPFLLHEYLAVFDLGARFRVRHLAVESVDPDVPIVVRRVTVRDGQEPAQPHAGRWRFDAATANVNVWENLHAMPRAWLVGQVQTLPPREILHTLQSGTLPNGAPFDPHALALVERPLVLDAPRAGDRQVDVLTIEPLRVRLRTRSSTAAFLVLSDVNYPGWTATLDAAPVPIHQTNYLLRGVNVPAGDHVIEFRFRPWSVYLGQALGAVSVLVLAVVWWRDR